MKVADLNKMVRKIKDISTEHFLDELEREMKKDKRGSDHTSSEIAHLNLQLIRGLISGKLSDRKINELIKEYEGNDNDRNARHKSVNETLNLIGLIEKFDLPDDKARFVSAMKKCLMGEVMGN